MPALRDHYPVLLGIECLAGPQPPHLLLEFCLLLLPYTPLTYSVSLVNVRRLIRRIAFFFSMRRCSLLETNQRLRRTVLNTPLLTTFLRKRLSRESCDSPLRKFTPANEIHLLPHGRSRHKKSADVQTRPKRIFKTKVKMID